MFQIKHVGKLLLISVLVVLTGCASVPMASKEQNAVSKTFRAPPSDLAGIYIYRNSRAGPMHTKRISIDNVVIGKSARYTFFHKLISPGKHTLSTESEFGDNSIQFNAAPGKNYFFHQYIKPGAFTPGANIDEVSAEAGKEGVLECDEALSSD